ncbi:hypothetical protein CHS0354_027139 [Potamilus streckersoni]|uniref:RRM domain-containing protein n=1 Tax=Potamilus streckersoni TaxID=2493646 RepID=A0AAE0SYJ7_9BIVA|nr:hypothetical protein CHS0354_027139 [Potamilus streckersoni]
MSRIIVKNLPNGIKEERLHNLFGSIGQITDCSLKLTKSGKFRKFAFIGFKTIEAAQSAVKQLNKTFIDTSRIEVAIACDFGDQSKPKAWSKYSKESSAIKEGKGKLFDKDEVKEKKKNKAREEVMDELLGELKDDPGFQEFLEAHANVGNKPVWTNDSTLPRKSTSVGKANNDGQDKLELDDEMSSNDASDDNEEEREKSVSTKEKKRTLKEDLNKVANKKNLSDLEYLKSKMGETALLSDSDVEADTSNIVLEEQEVSQKATQQSHDNESGMKVQQKKHALKLKGLPVIAGEKAVKEFFKPLKPSSIRIPRNVKKKSIGIAYVEFANEKDLEQAMRRNKNFIGGKRIYLKKSEIEDSAAETTVEDSTKPWERKLQESSIEDEDIAESGRLFVRNLAYCCTEEDLSKLFEKYGPLTEVHLPIDTFTKKLKGFAFVTFMIPEHAVKAYAELDGTVFQGRMMHILSGKAKKEDDIEITERSSYKKKKEAKQKIIASSSHNWNSLFLGANAVADVMAEKYGASKSEILDVEKTKSLGVRLALGETQIVSETRDFLLENGVVLDSFSNPAGPRSKSVILVKNLPSGTKSEEIQELFAKFGTLGKVILPPSGITAIVEYLEATEAKAGFTKLAYTKFKHVPLYLEWAPMDVLKKETHPNQEKEETDDKDISKMKVRNIV